MVKLTKTPKRTLKSPKPQKTFCKTHKIQKTPYKVWWKEFQDSETLKDAKAAGLENLCDKKRYDSSSQYSREERRLFLQWLSFEDRKLLQEGLGNSQKAEVAWLERKGYRYTEVDIASWLRPAAKSYFPSGPLPAMEAWKIHPQ